MNAKQNQKSQNQVKEETKMPNETTIDVAAVVTEAAPTPKRRGRRKGAKVERKSRKLPLPSVPEGKFGSAQDFDPKTHSMFVPDKFCEVFQNGLDGWKTMVAYRRRQLENAEAEVTKLSKLSNPAAQNVMMSLGKEIEGLADKIKRLKAQTESPEVMAEVSPELQDQIAAITALLIAKQS